MKPLLSIEEVEQFLNISERTIRRLVSDGSLKAYQIGGQLRFMEDDLINFIKRNEVIRPTPAFGDDKPGVQFDEEIHSWLFQAKPENFPEIYTMRPGYSNSFSVRQYGQRMSDGDDMVIWLSGKQGGIYAIGKLIGTVYDRPPEHEFGPKGVNYEVQRVLQKPILRSVLKLHPILRHLQVIRKGIGTNFPIRANEWQAIMDLVDQEG